MNSPTSPRPGTSRFVIRPIGTLWSLEDETQQIGGVFTTLEAALAFARTERLNGGAIRIVIGEQPLPASGLRAA